MCSQHTNCTSGPRRRQGRTVVRLDAAALWDRLALLNRSQNWLAGETGISPSYLSKLVNGGARPRDASAEGCSKPSAWTTSTSFSVWR